MKFSIKDFFSKCDQIRSKLRIWSYLLNKSFMENFIFCAVDVGFHFFVAILKSLTLSMRLISAMMRSQIFKQRNFILSVPLKGYVYMIFALLVKNTYLWHKKNIHYFWNFTVNSFKHFNTLPLNVLIVNRDSAI